jgi:hypothetical protein
MPLAADPFDPRRFFVALVISAGLSMLIYWHASRNSNPRATLWGVLTFLAAGLVVPAYFILFWIRQRRR